MPKLLSRRGFTTTLLLHAILACPIPDVWAHAVITESSLEKSPIDPDIPATPVLYFNTNIELALSKFFLISKGDIHQPVPIHAGNKPGEVMIDLPPLRAGEYALRYKVFAADGHLTEDVIYFHVSGQR
jgi:methionine-rich copper-binding protein CopC